jgi:LmbE family N-acetylglucosaminyl deacetylase
MKLAIGVPTLNILILSPHRNDAAFSLSLAITHWLASGHTVTILNVFTRSLHAPFSDADFVHENDRLSYVSAMRLREDELWIQRITQDLPRARKSHLQMVDLNLKDAPIRLRTAEDRLYDTAINPEDPAIEKIQKALTRQIQAGTLEALVIPLALGNHIDHLTVRVAAAPFTANRPTAFYEDLLDATLPNVSAVLEALAADTAPFEQAEPLTPTLLRHEAAADHKRHLVLGYASQIDEEAADLIAAFATQYEGAERLWTNQAWLSGISSTQ